MYLCKALQVQTEFILKKMKFNKKSIGHLAIFTSSFIFGIYLPLSKTILSVYIDAQTLTVFRFCGAALLFWIASLFIKKEPVPFKDLLLMFGASLFGVVINQFAFLEGLSKSSVIDTGIIQTTTPIITMLLAALFLKEPITGRKVLGVLVGLSGALLLVFANGFKSDESSSLIGILLLISSAFTFALYLTLFRSLIVRYSPITLMKWLFLFAAIIGISIYGKRITEFDLVNMPSMVYFKIAYVVVAATFITYLLIPIAQKKVAPNYDQYV